MGHDYKAPLAQHASQTDAAKGFGGKYGVQQDRKDKAAVGYDHHEKVEKHASQKGMPAVIFGRWVLLYDQK